MAIARGLVWGAGPRLATGRLTGEAAVGLPARLVTAFGSVWVADWDANRLLRF